jgi:YHS domain-containing protein
MKCRGKNKNMQFFNYLFWVGMWYRWVRRWMCGVRNAQRIDVSHNQRKKEKKKQSKKKRTQMLVPFVVLLMTWVSVCAGLTCPVCSMTFEPTSGIPLPWTKPGSLPQTTYFCSKSCRSSFIDQPAKYFTGPRPAALSALTESTTASENPRLVRKRTSDQGQMQCPVCGMKV